MSELEDALREQVADVAAAYFSNSPTAISDIQRVIDEIAAALGRVGGAPAAADAAESAATETAPALPKLTAAQIRKSITPAALISFEDGKPYKTLRRHLSTKGLTPEQYREKWGLPGDYPTVSASYSAQRSAMAKAIGLGAKGRGARPTAPAKRGRGKAAAS